MSAAAVSRILREAGFDKSEYHGSRQVRGWGERTAGFEVSPDGIRTAENNYRLKRNGRSFVEYKRRTWDRGADPRRELSYLNQYAAALMERGYAVVCEDNDGRLRLVVEKASKS